MHITLLAMSRAPFFHCCSIAATQQYAIPVTAMLKGNRKDTKKMSEKVVEWNEKHILVNHRIPSKIKLE